MSTETAAIEAAYAGVAGAAVTADTRAIAGVARAITGKARTTVVRSTVAAIGVPGTGVVVVIVAAADAIRHHA